MASQDGKPQQFRIVLLGDSGSGKSATGNTILGKRAFTTRQSEDPETLTCQAESGEFEGTPLSLVYTPWTITAEKPKCISFSGPGPHAFLLMIPLFTDVERHVEILHQMFGKEASRYTIVLFTHGDELPDGVTTEEFIRQHPLPYGVGYHVFNNRSEDPSQDRELLEKIKRMVERNGGSYCLNVKDWKQKYLYPFPNAITIGGAIGAASGGTGGGALLAFFGAFIGVIAAHVGRKRINFNVAVVVAAAVAVAFAGAGAVFVAVAGTVFYLVALAFVIGGLAVLIICKAGTTVTTALKVAIPLLIAGGHGFAAGVTLFGLAVVAVVVSAVEVVDIVYLAAVGAVCIAVAGARAVDSDMGVVDALVAGVVVGAGITAKTAGAMFAGARAESAAFDDIQAYNELLGIIGGAGVGAGVSAAIGVYPDLFCADFTASYDSYCAVFPALLGVSMVLLAIYMTVYEAASTIDKITGFAIVAGVSAGAAFGAFVCYCWHNDTLQPVVSWLLATFTSNKAGND